MENYLLGSASASSGLTADDLEHGALCVLAGAARPGVVRAALLGGAARALAALLALPDRAANLLDDSEKVPTPQINRSTELEFTRPHGLVYACASFVIGGRSTRLSTMTYTKKHLF